MNSIINPWVFYWIGIVDSVRTLLIVILTVLMIGGAIMFMCTMSDADDRGFKDKDVAEEVKLCIKVAIATFVVAVLVCVVPSEDTCYKITHLESEAAADLVLGNSDNPAHPLLNA